MAASATFDVEQAALLALLVGMLVVFALDRYRIEIVALCGLALGYALGLVPGAVVFDGFANPAVVTVVEILLIVQVLARARLLDALARHVVAAGLAEWQIVLGLCTLSAVTSVFMNNIGALALMLPVIATVSEAARVDRRKLLIPVSYATLLGGMCSLIGTPANLLVNQTLVAAGDTPIGFFDFAVAGLPMTAIGLLVILLWVPRRFAKQIEAEADRSTASLRNIVTEGIVPPGSPLIDLPLPKAGERFGFEGHRVIRDGKAIFAKPSALLLRQGDLLVLTIDLGTLDRLHESGTLGPVASTRPAAARIEAAVMPESTLVGSPVATMHIFRRRGVRIVGVSTRSTRIEGRLADIRLAIGDVLVLEGDAEAIAEAVAESEVLQLTPSRAPRPLLRSWLPPAAFAAAIAASAAGLLTPELAFAGVLLVLALAGQINLRSAFADLNWPIIVMLAAMIPLGKAVETTGAAAVLAASLMAVLPPHAPFALLVATVLLAVAVTPFVNNASTAIVLAPIALAVARAAGLPPEPFLIAVAAGASTDFLTPFGHHNNTLVMTIGGYRFTDFLKCGWPLTLASAATGSISLAIVWGL